MKWSRLRICLGTISMYVFTGCAPAPGPDPDSSGNEPAAAWTTQVSGAGIALTLSASGRPLIRAACARNPAAMRIEVPGFELVGSEDRLSFGVDGEPFVFVADLAEDRPSGVEAEAPIEDALLVRWLAAEEISAVYGAQTAGPYAPPDPEAREQFVAACRAIAAEPGSRGAAAP